jgi:chaperonin GroES
LTFFKNLCNIRIQKFKLGGLEMNFKPLGDRLLVKRVEEATTTASGIIIPDNAKEKPSRGSVIAIGDEVEGVSVNDTVVFGKYAGTELNLDSEEYLVLELSDILGVIA